MRTSTSKALRIGVGALVGAWLAYLLLGNGYLNLGAIGKPILSQEAAEVRVGSAFTWWPGVIRGRNLRILVHDSNVEMDLRIDRFDVSLSLPAVLKKTLSTSRTNLDGLSLRLRLTRQLPKLCRQAPGLPTIPGQAEPPGVAGKDCLAQVETASPKGTPPRPEDLFRVKLERLDVSRVREIWIEGYRVEGAAAFRGRWAFWPTQYLEIGLENFIMRDARVRQGERKLAGDLDLSLAGKLTTIQLSGLEASELWKSVSVRASIRLRDLQLETVRRVLLKANPIAPPKFPDLDGLANVQSDMDLEAGRVRSFSMEAQADQAAIELLDRRLKGRMLLAANLAEEKERPGRLLLARSHLAIHDPQLGEGNETKRFPDTEITVSALGDSRLEPQRQRADLEFRAEVSRLKFLVELIPGGLPRTAAKLLLEDDVPMVATGKLHVTPGDAEIRELKAEGSGLTLTGGLAFAPKLNGTLNAKIAFVSVDIPLSSNSH